jgi:choline dehydrogenase-like flavoprotein
MLPGTPFAGGEFTMKKVIVVGSGAGGATVAKELQGRFDVTVIEAGSAFKPFTANLSPIEKVKRTGALFDERLIRLIFPAMNVTRAQGGMVLVKGIGYGGSTVLSAGNAVRMDGDLKSLGIDLDAEFAEISQEIPVFVEHGKTWHEPTRQAYAICQEMGLKPAMTPKMIYPERCVGCGKCVLGCPRGAKWDSRRYLNQALRRGARLISNTRVQKVCIQDGRATGVIAARGWRRQFFPADLVILAAGGLGSPVILQRSGIKCEDRLFVDPVLCVAAQIDGSRQNAEIPMPFIVQKEHYILSPYFDFLSFFFNRRWRYPAGSIYSLMIKLADTNSGSIAGRRVNKRLSDLDLQRLQEGVETCKQIFHRLGKKDDEVFLGTLNAGHPGGMLPLTAHEASSFHHPRLPANLYLSDATLLPRSLGNPPILTIVATAKRVSKECLKFA